MPLLSTQAAAADAAAGAAAGALAAGAADPLSPTRSDLDEAQGVVYEGYAQVMASVDKQARGQARGCGSARSRKQGGRWVGLAKWAVLEVLQHCSGNPADILEPVAC